jgi:hypothetical protein
LDFSTRLTGYQTELGPNAYAVFNTLLDHILAALTQEEQHDLLDGACC